MASCGSLQVVKSGLVISQKTRRPLSDRNIGDFDQRHPKLALPIVVAGDDVGAGAKTLFAVPRPVQSIGRNEGVIPLIRTVGRIGMPVPDVGDHLVATSRVGVLGVFEDVGQARSGGDGIVPAGHAGFDRADGRLAPMDAVGAGCVERGIGGKMGRRVADVPHFEKLFFAIEEHIAVKLDPPAFPRLIGNHERIGRMLAPDEA